MKVIKLNDREARIWRIEFDPDGNRTIVDLGWGGPNERFIYEFDTDLLGEVSAIGGGHRDGWVILTGGCRFRVGDTIPLA